MKLEQLLAATTEEIPVADLQQLASDKNTYGQDAVEAFARQSEIRGSAMRAILDAAKAGDGLQASEQRKFDGLDRTRDLIIKAQAQVEQRTAANAYNPPKAVALATETRETEDNDAAVVLTREQRMTDYVQRTAKVAGLRASSFGRVLLAYITGNRSRLNEFEQRALAEGSGSTGGYAVSAPLAANLIDLVRAQSVAFRAGATLVPMTSSTLTIAKLVAFGAGSPPGVGSPAPGWHQENQDDVSEMAAELDRVVFTARTLPAILTMSLELSQDAANLETLVTNALVKSLALELDRVCFYGSGSAPEPKGLVNIAGIDAAAMDSADYDGLIEAIAAVKGRNFTPNARVYNTDFAATLAKLRGTVTGDYLSAPKFVADVPEYLSNQIVASGSPSVGSPSSISDVFVGDFSNLLVGMRQDTVIETSRVAAGSFEKLQVKIRAFLRADVATAHDEAFAIRTA